MAHDAFISYSRKDKELAIPLHKALSSYVPPKDLRLSNRRLDVFRDAEDFTGAEYYQSLERHLGSSSKLIVICSPAARASQFVNDEIRRFVRMKGPEHIIALLAAGIPNNEATPEQAAQMAFPDALCEAMKMPLAADYRGFDPKRSKVDRGAYEASWYTTLANLYDVSRATIEQREKKRRARRRRIAFGATVTSVIILAGLLFFAWNQRQDAVRQQGVAAARLLTGQAVSIANGSTPHSQGMRLRALTAAESLRTAWTSEGYAAWRRATLRMPPLLGKIGTDSMFIRMQFTADGTRLFALCGERHIHVLSVPALRELKNFAALETAYQLAIDSKGEHALAYQANDEFLEAFTVQTGAKRNIFLPGNFQAAAFNPSGDALVISPTHLWVLDANSEEAHSRIAFPAGVASAVLSPDGSTALTLSEKSTTAYDTANGKVLWERAPGKDAVREATFRGDGRAVLLRGTSELSIIAASSGETLQSAAADTEASGRARLLSGALYSIGNAVYETSGKQVRSLPFADDPPPLSALPEASSSGRYVAGVLKKQSESFGVVDLSIRDNVPEGYDADFYLTLREGHRGTVAAFTPDGSLLALSSATPGHGPDQDAELQLVLLKPQPWQPMFPSRSRTGDLNVLPPDSRVVAKLWSAPAARSFRADGTPVADDSTGTFVSPSGRFAARLEAGKSWIVTDTREKRSITLPANSSPLEFSPEEDRVLVFPNVYSLADPATPRVVAEAKPFFATWSFPGSNLVIGADADSSGTGEARKSTLFDWKTLTTTDGPPSLHYTYAVSPDGRRFVTYDHDAILLWSAGAAAPDVRSGRAVVSHDTPAYFSPDDRFIAVAKCRGVPLYDAHTLELRYEVPIGPVSCFAGFSLDGNYLVSRTWHSDVPEPTLHPITLKAVLAETCVKVFDGLTERERERLGVARALPCTR